MKDNINELFPVVDTTGKVIGKITRGEAHGGSMILHPVVHLHVFNTKGELYLQKRPEWKDIQPGKWDTATGGHIDFGETVDEALVREVKEELGIEDFKPKYKTYYVFESKCEKELVYVFTTIYDGVISPNKGELAGGRFWNKSEIISNLGKNIFTPNFENEYIKVLNCKS